MKLYNSKIGKILVQRARRNEVSRNWLERGDSLIEVLLSMTILSMVAVGSMVTMNSGQSLVQNALFRTQVRSVVDSQTELLNFARGNTTSTVWNNIQSYSYVNPTSSQLATANESAASKYAPISGQSFCLYIDNNGNLNTVLYNSSSANIVIPSTNQQQIYDGLPTGSSSGTTPVCSGVWVNAVYYSGVAKPYYDFYIFGAWSPVGSNSGSQSRSITIVRIMG